MKKKHALLFLYLFFSSILFGQIDNKSNSTPDDNCSQVDVWIKKIVWNTNLNGLVNIMNTERKLAPYSIPGPGSSFFQPNVDPAHHNSTFHVAVLRYDAGDEGTNRPSTFEFEASLNLSYHHDKPIYLVYTHNRDMSTTSIDDYTVQFNKTSDDTMNKSDEGGGVITTAGVKGRSSINSGGKVGGTYGGVPVFGGGNSNSHCMNLEVYNRVTNGTCTSSQPVYSTKCAGIPAHSKVETDDALSINSYPNPVHNHLFVETEGLDVRAINLLNLQGQSLNHQVDVSHTESTWQVNTSKLEAGLYILQVETDAGSSVKKVYVQ